MPKGKEVSDKQMNLADTLEYRGKREGYGDFSDVSEGIGKLDHLLLGEYLMEHFPDATKAGQTCWITSWSIFWKEKEATGRIWKLL